MDELRLVKSDAVKMRTKIQEANKVIQDTGGQLLETGKELKLVHAMQLNVYATMDVLTRCIPGQWLCICLFVYLFTYFCHCTWYREHTYEEQVQLLIVSLSLNLTCYTV